MIPDYLENKDKYGKELEIQDKKLHDEYVSELMSSQNDF